MLDKINVGQNRVISRRAVLCAGALGGLLIPAASAAARAALSAMPDTGTFSITFRNQHTGESFSGAYKVGTRYIPEAFEKINYVLRDFRTGEVFPIDPRVIDMMYLAQQNAGVRGAYEVLSGYRSARTNAMLGTSSGAVASNSLHMTGQAIDLRLPGIATNRLADITTGLRVGGVGYYRRSNFVHMDTGQVRRWSV